MAFFRFFNHFTRSVNETIGWQQIDRTVSSVDYSTVTDLARFLGWSTSVPMKLAVW